MNITQFIRHYYINPIVYDTKYNPVDTIAYAIVLGLCLFGVLRLLKKLNVRIDERFILATSPYIILGSVLRVAEDAEIFEAPVRYLFITPLIYFLIFFICVSSLVISVKLFKIKKISDYNRLFGFIGVAWIIVSLTMLLMEKSVEVMWVPFAVFSIAIAVSSVFYAIGHYMGLDFLKNKISFAILTGHLVDASSSYIGIEKLGYVGKHVVESFLIKYTDSALVMYPLKIIILIPTLYILHEYFTDEGEIDLKNLVLLVVLVLGFAPGVRNTIRMTLGV